MNRRNLAVAVTATGIMIAAFLPHTGKAQGAFRDNNIDGNWAASATWTLESGSDADGVPDVDDAVRLRTKATDATYTITAAAGWACDTLTLELSSGTGNERHRLSLTGNGAARVINFYDNHTTGFRGPEIAFDGSSYTLTVSELHSLGPETPSWAVSCVWGIFAFSGEAVITYNTKAMNEMCSANDFSAASSILLQRSVASASLTTETLASASGGNRTPFTIGRADNQAQTWSVASGSRPVLLARANSQNEAFKKVGTAAVHMPDVDLLTAQGAANNAGLSSNGRMAGAGTALYAGTVYANSLSYVRDNHATVYDRRFDVVGTLSLDGQAGLQAGGSGNGRAFDVTSNTNGLTTVRIGSLSPVGNPGQAKRGRVETVGTGTGSFYLNGPTPAGRVKLEIYCPAAERPNPFVIANTIHLASPRVSINDRDPNNDTDANAGGTLEFRGHFINASQQAADFRTDKSTLHCTAGWTNTASIIECPSQDLGTAGPGASNFLLNKLIVGKAADAVTGQKRLMLADDYDNNTLDAEPEALYVNTLELHAGSEIVLQGRNLYVKNSGSWVQAIPGAFAGGDGTGRIIRKIPNDGTTVLVK